MKTILDQLEEAEKSTPSTFGINSPDDLGYRDMRLYILMRNNIRALIDIAKAADSFKDEWNKLLQQPLDISDLEEALAKLNRG